VKFERSLAEIESYTATVEIDSETDFSEQYVAINALGALALQDEPSQQTSISYLAARVRKAEPAEGEAGSSDTSNSEKPKPVNTDISPQEAEVLANALRHYATLTKDDVNYFAVMRNYSAVTTRVVERDLAETMADVIEDVYTLDRAATAKTSTFGFGAVLD
jgi:hypothetical protein